MRLTQAVPISLHMPGQDVFLQPHSDDICFSLGAFAARPIRGLMLTIFPVARWVHPAAFTVAPSPEEVTQLRKAEDQTFGHDAGLSVQFMTLPGASNLGYSSFELSRVAENRERVQGPLMETLRQIASAHPKIVRPWLFCPAGIGGHVDHVAVLQTIASHAAELSCQFRIAYYEDLHYASRWRSRVAGLIRLLSVTHGTRLQRFIFEVDADLAIRKRNLIAHYASQIEAPPSDLTDYCPATIPRSRPHEAIWTEELPPDGFAPAAQAFELGVFFLQVWKLAHRSHYNLERHP